METVSILHTAKAARAATLAAGPAVKTGPLHIPIAAEGVEGLSCLAAVVMAEQVRGEQTVRPMALVARAVPLVAEAAVLQAR